MKLAKSRITSQGQLSVPAAVRERLELSPGSILEWEDEGDRVTVRRVGRHSSEDIHDAVFPRTPRAHTIDELREGIRHHARARHARR